MAFTTISADFASSVLLMRIVIHSMPMKSTLQPFND